MDIFYVLCPLPVALNLGIQHSAYGEIGISVWLVICMLLSAFIYYVKLKIDWARSKRTRKFTTEQLERKAFISRVVEWLKSDSKTEDWVKDASQFCDGKDFGENNGKKLLVIINPHGGEKTADKLFKLYFKPVLEKLGFDNLHIVYTTHPKHATEFVSTYDLSDLYGIAVFGGDGTQSEVIRGLHAHKQKDQALDIPVGPVPSGSGNMIFAMIDEWGNTQNLRTGDAEEIISAALRIASGKTQPFEIGKVDFEDVDGRKGTDVSPLGVLQGSTILLLEIAEKLRWTRIGWFRYIVAAVFAGLKGFKYHVKMTYVPEKSEDGNPKPVIEEKTFSSFTGFTLDSNVDVNAPAAAGKKTMHDQLLYCSIGWQDRFNCRSITVEAKEGHLGRILLEGERVQGFESSKMKKITITFTEKACTVFV